jgi:hypothetical protein
LACYEVFERPSRPILEVEDTLTPEETLAILAQIGDSALRSLVEDLGDRELLTLVEL